MAPRTGCSPSIKLSSSISHSSSTSTPQSRRQSSSEPSTSQPSSPTTPRVQLIPHARAASLNVALTGAERDLLDGTSFDRLDLSSKDFDFEDIFTYDKPQKKLPRVVEVNTMARERDWSSFSFSHYTAAMTARARANRNRSGVSERHSNK